MPEPTRQISSERWSASSLAGRLLAVTLGGVVLSAVLVSAIAVHTTYAFLRREMDRTVPVTLQEAERHVEDLLARARARLPEALDASEPRQGPPEPWTTLEPLPAGETPAVLWRRGVSGPQLGLAVDDGAGERVAWLARESLERALPVGDPERTRLRLIPDPPLAGEPGDAAGGWPASPEPYRNRAGELVVGASRAVPAAAGRLVLEIPFDTAFEPVLEVLVRVALVNALLLVGFALLARRVTRKTVGPILALAGGARRISEGQLDVAIEPIPVQDELALLTRTFNEMADDLRCQRDDIVTANERLQQKNDALQAANEVLGQLSITDGLTKLHNHRFFQDFLTREIKRTGRSGEPLSMLFIDIDDFKRLNDQLGHASGDELLVRLAEILNDCVRESDLVARYGGEEFVVLAPNTDAPGALLLAEKIRHGVSSASFILDDTMRLTKMTVSVGVNTYRGSRKAFFQGADDALYRAKAEGKNCVVAHEPEDDAEPSETDERGDVGASI